MLIAALAALALSAQPMPVAAPPQVDPDTPFQLNDLEVTGRRLESLVRDFVVDVGAPVRNRDLARWSRSVCPGTVNLRTAEAQYFIDRIATTAMSVGLNPAGPGCDPNVIIIFAVDADPVTRAFVAQAPRRFVSGGAGTDRGRAQLAKFQTTDAPVRWWHSSMPVFSDTGERATRLPGDIIGNGAGVGGQDTTFAYAPSVRTTVSSRLRSEIVDNLSKVYIVVDAGKLEGTTPDQLADYLSFLALAQVDPEAETRGYATILNLFDDPQGTPGLTDLDRAYLKGLYESERNLGNASSQTQEVANSIVRAHHAIRAAQGE
jgi:hypothetical protein